MQYEVIKNQNTNHNANGILADQIIKLTDYASSGKYPGELRRIVYYAEFLNHTYVYLTNNIEAPAYQIALLYKYRWHVEQFFKWIKQHLEIKSFWGTTEGAVRIQIFTAIIAYCMVAIVEHDLHLNRSTYEVLRVLSASLLDKTPVRDIFFKETNMDENDIQLKLNFF